MPRSVLVPDHRPHRPLPVPRLQCAIAALAGSLGTSPLLAQEAAVMPTVRATAQAPGDGPSGKDSVRATTTRIGKGEAVLRDVAQSITVLTEKLLDDRNLDTLKDSLRTTGGVAFQAAEGSEEDIRLRGFSLQASGDIFIDGLRDPAFYERDSFNWDRLEVLRGSASMLFGRGSTGGVVNQVSKAPRLLTQHEVAVTLGNHGFARGTADLNWRLDADSALRINAMGNLGDTDGVGIDKRGIAPTYRWGIGQRHEFQVGLLSLRNDNGIHYGLPWITPGASGGNWIWPTDPARYYGMASDRNETGTTQWTGSHRWRIDGDAEWRTQVRSARSTREQRASAIRFAAANLQPGGVAVTADTFSPSTVLTRGTNIKSMDLDTLALQSDLNGRWQLAGLTHAVQAGVDLAVDRFENRAASLPAGVVLTKPRTTVGEPDDGASVDESLRILTPDRRFEARSAGVYLQDLVQVAPNWKLLGGVRWDQLDGRYTNLTISQPTNVCAVVPSTELRRSDSLWSHRAAVLFQPTASQSYHLGYATSFNTSGDTYQYDAGTAATGPEGSRNLELGGQVEWLGGRLSTRAALFRSTKTNERNRDADSVDSCNYVLSGERHAQGVEIDVTGRVGSRVELWGSYAWIPVARVDASSGAVGTEAVGSRPGLTPRHSGSVWAAWRVHPHWRVGAGLNARSSDKPVGLPPTSALVAPAYVTADLMAEYRHQDLTHKLSVNNVTDAHTADSLYRAHYVPGKPRTVQWTVSYAFN